MYVSSGDLKKIIYLFFNEGMNRYYILRIEVWTWK